MSGAPLLALGDLEVAAGFPIGAASDEPLPDAPCLTPAAALERAILPALVRTPCLVSFSGGRDSSAVLATATRLARREGLPPPVPFTLRFPGAPASDEAGWQERVVRHLGLVDWERKVIGAELDLIGPVAQQLLRRHGLLWPPNTHFHTPILERARGGSVLTGVDGDGLFASWRWVRPVRVLRGQVRPRARDAGRIALAMSPPWARSAVERRRAAVVLPWLTPSAQAELHAIRCREAAEEPARWDRWVPWYARRRALRMVLQGLQLIADDTRALVVSPLADPLFLASVARQGGRLGIGDRDAATEMLFGDLLPSDVVHRRSKAILDGPFWNRYSRDFALHWNGGGVDATIVDHAALGREWLAPSPHACASTLLQAAWLSSAPGSRPSSEELI
jgi:asparagine synthase (glutamine-hydrolysing)